MKPPKVLLFVVPTQELVVQTFNECVDSGVICSGFVLCTEEFFFVGSSGFLKAVWHWIRVDYNTMNPKLPLQLHTECSTVFLLLHGAAIPRRIWLRASGGRFSLAHLILN